MLSGFELYARWVPLACEQAFGQAGNWGEGMIFKCH